MNQFKTLTQIRNEMLSLPTSKFWPIGPESGQVLKQQVNKFKPSKILEIGTSSGYSTTWILESLEDSNAEIITIESNQERYNIAQDFFQQINFQNTKLTHIRHHAPEVFPELDLDNLDFIFCDAIKNQTLELYLLLRQKMTPNGVFIADNVISHKNSMLDLYEYLRAHDIKHEIVPSGAGLVIIPNQ